MGFKRWHRSKIKASRVKNMHQDDNSRFELSSIKSFDFDTPLLFCVIASAIIFYRIRRIKNLRL